ncbi:MAG: phosphate ABC transporter ATP-binding protein, partial [Acinetobacter sp.]|nr:phosphate ABC transporter ATP-binding protein [Acinetobacter sp.]
MNTIDIMNAVEKDKSVNPQQTEFTSSEAQVQQSNTAFVSQFETASSNKKPKTSEVKISTKDVHVYYGETEAIKGIDLDIYQNEVIA